MYKVVLWGLAVLSFIAIIFGFTGLLPFSGLSLIYSLVTLVVVCYVTNWGFSRILKVPTNSESYFITSLILFFVLYPLSSVSELKIFILVGVVAMASKYVLAIGKKHMFNPAAVAVFIVSLFGLDLASWWIGSFAMLVPALIVGFLVLRKVDRFSMFFTFIGASVVSSLIFGHFNGADFYEIFASVFVSGPVVFLGAIMLTEPLTTPPKKKWQMVYGIIVGLLFGSQFSFGPVYSTPALALVIGNIFSYLVSPRLRLVLTLLEKNKLTADVYEFVWKLDKTIAFRAGQYLEWTLGHAKPDVRGNRRYFTIASSPTESVLRLGIKSYDNSSSFKKKLLSLEPGDTLVASQLSGEFTLPQDQSRKLVFIAGGIGVTPFRSMVKYLVDAKEKREVTLFFSNRTPKDIVYKDTFDEAKSAFGMKTLYVVNDLAGTTQTDDMRVGFIDAQMIMKEVPDYKECEFYISGPHGMVSAFEVTLGKLGVPKARIKTDFFPGYV